MTTTTPNELLDFWLGPKAQRDAPDDALIERWWAKDPAFDATLRERFGASVEAALAGALDRWGDEALSCVALILLLDQLPRNLFRGTGRMYAGDGQAVRHACALISSGQDTDLRHAERYFVYMPLMHSEDAAHQHDCVSHFERLAADAPHLDATKWACAHRDIVARFGRFPHRNALLGRATTPEEAEFLRQPGSSF